MPMAMVMGSSSRPQNSAFGHVQEAEVDVR